MERVVAVGGALSTPGKAADLPGAAGVIEKQIRAGQFWARLESGQRVRVHSSADLSAGQKVSVLPAPTAAPAPAEMTKVASPALVDQAGAFWTVLMPFDFGLGESTAKLEIFVEKSKKHSLDKAGRASFLIFTTDFADGDRVQWSIYLKNKNVSLQIYSSDGTSERHDIVKLSAEIEKKLKKMGFLLAAPTTRLAKLFKVPKGFGLNVRA
jgi:hypothetical protein